MGGLDPATGKLLRSFGKKGTSSTRWLKPGTVIVRQYAGALHEVMVTPQGFCWRGETFTSLSGVAPQITGTIWNDARFLGLQGDIRAQTVAIGGGSEKGTVLCNKGTALRHLHAQIDGP